ncbi:MAG: hypothetical protein SPI77_01455 [Corynebacterium sp.]|nr:hypothetical protein [Corynebacterium sp.]
MTDETPLAAEAVETTEKSAKEEIREELEKTLPGFIMHPTSRDKKIWVAFLAVTVISYVFLFLRVWFINNPIWYSLIIGGYTSAVVLGANQSQGIPSWPYVLLCIVGTAKFIPVYYIMGKYWGKDFLYYVTQYYPRLHKWLKNLVEHRPDRLKAWGYGLTPLTSLPAMRINDTITVPMLALVRVKLGPIIAVNVLATVVVNYIFFGLGFTFGDQVLEVIKVINKYVGWVIFGLIAFAVISAVMKSSRSAADQ